MEWGGLLIQALMLGGFLCWEGYFKEKGRNLATKEDIAGITKEIESVKDSYNKSLESHKIELQKDFESYRYITAICNSIDKELLRRLIKCKSEIESDLREFYNNSDIGASKTSIYCLCSYLQSYSIRYGENENVQFILLLYRNIERLNSFDNHEYDRNDGSCAGTKFDSLQFRSEIETMSNYVNKLIAQFLPKFK